MSLDLQLVIDAGGEHPAVLWDEWNYTHNVNKMYRLLFDGQTLGDFLQGKVAGDTINDLIKAVYELGVNIDKFRLMDPENGWGSADALFGMMNQLIVAAQRFPKATWRAWK